MTFPLFPTLAGLEFPVKRTPTASTLRQKAISGRQTFQAVYPNPLYKYEISFSVLNAANTPRGATAAQEWQTLEGFWKAVMFTAANGIFQYYDANDNSVTGQATGSGDGTTTTFQLVRSLGGFAEPILLPTPVVTVPSVDLDYGNCTVAPTINLDYGNCTVAPTVDLMYGYCSTMQVFVAGLLAPWSFVGGSAAASGGEIIISPAPAANAALTWTGTYNWLCQFDEDTAEFSQFFYLLYEMKKCSFTTVRL